MRRIVILLFLILLIPSCERNEVFSRTELRMDTLCTISVYTRKDEALLDQAFEIIDRVSAMIDMYDSESEISRVNSLASAEPVAVSDELFSLLMKAYDVSEYTDGAFNLAIGPLVALWGIGGENARLPSEAEIAKVLPLLDWHDIILDEDEKTVFFKKEGMRIDLGGVGKGYIADLIAEMFRKSGTESALINLGGNVYGLGTKSDGEPWKVGLQDPFSEHGGYFTTVSCSDASVVTSGGYERHFIAEDGRIYHHLLDWKTGYPASSDIISSTIISSDSTLSDMLSTACFVLGSERAEAVVDHYGVSALFLLTDGSIERIRI